MTETSFSLTLTPDAVWFIRSAIRPGLEIDWPLDSPQAKADVVARILRRKINNCILRMIDEDISTVEIDCTEDEAWIIDSNLSFDGDGNPATGILIQIFRGLWYLDIGQHIADLPDLVEDPRGGWSNRTFKDISRTSDVPPYTIDPPTDFTEDDLSMPTT